MDKKTRLYEKAPFTLINAPGVSYEGENMIVNPELLPHELKEVVEYQQPNIVKRFTHYKPKANSKHYDLAAAHVAPGVSIDDFGFYKAVVSSSIIDSARHRFGRKFLKEMARQYKEGRSVLVMHQGLKGIGKTFDARVYADPEREGVHLLEVVFYISNSIRVGENLALDMVNQGIYDRLSVAVATWKATYVPADDSPDERSFLDFDDPEGMQVVELSLVHYGMNKDAKLKSNPDERAKFVTIENNKDTKAMKLINVTLKTLNDLVIEVPEGVETALKSLDQKAQEMQVELKKFQDQVKEKENALREKFFALTKQVVPEEKLNLESIAMQKEHMPVDWIEKRIGELEAAAAIFKANQVTSSPGKSKDFPAGLGKGPANGDDESASMEKVTAGIAIFSAIDGDTADQN